MATAKVTTIKFGNVKPSDKCKNCGYPIRKAGSAKTEQKSNGKKTSR